MLKTKKKIKILIAGTLVFALVCSSVGSAYAISIEEDTLAKYNVEKKKDYVDISLVNKFFINNSIEQCVSDGTIAAENINKMLNKEDDFEIGVRKVLDKYYSMKKSERGELAAFTSTIDESAKQIVANYAEAELERENKDNLTYETEKVLVSFPYGTPMDVIDTVVGNEAVSYKVVDDGEYHVNPNLPDYKLERLDGLEDVKSDIVVEVTNSLEDTVMRAADKFSQYNCVTTVSKNNFFEADGSIATSSGSVTTNDVGFSSLNQWNLANIDIPKAWNRFSSVSGIYSIWVAVIDSGVKMSHRDLNGVLLTDLSVDVTNNNRKLITCADAVSDYGMYTSAHGTRVTSVIAATGNNTYDIAGVASIASNSGCRNSVKIMAIKADNNGTTDERHITQAYLDAAIDYAVENGAEVINISYSALKEAYYYENVKYEHFNNLKSSIQTAVENDVVVVASVGNDSGSSKRYPAAFDGVIGVGASLYDGSLAPYSNDNSETVDIVAPGGDKDGTGDKICVLNIDGTTSYHGGTSYATPHVSATVAMMLSIKYGLTPNQILTRLINRGNYGTHGFIDLDTGESVYLMQEG